MDMDLLWKLLLAIGIGLMLFGFLEAIFKILADDFSDDDDWEGPWD